MATKIVTKNSSTASAVPTASDLVQGELAVNVADKRLFTEDNGGAIVELGTNPSTIDINAGTIDGTTVGASSASTGAFTTLTATGLDVTGTATMDAATVQTTGSTTAVLTLNNADGNGTLSQINLGYTADPDHGNISYTGDMIFTAGAAERMRISSAGNVGIGTSSPSSELTIGADTPQIDLLKASSADVLANIRAETDAGSGGKLVFQTKRNGNTALDRMTIDDDGNVGIGTSSPQYITEIAKTQAGGIGPTLYLHNTADNAAVGHAAEIRFNLRGAEATTRNAAIQAVAEGTYGTSPALTFLTSSGDTGSATERMRIDSSGNLLVGKTATAFGTAGVVLRGDSAEGLIQATRANNECIEVNRTGTDGAIAIFAKDGTSVGSIGTVSGDIRIGGLDDNHASIRFAASSKAVLPVKNSDGGLSDNTTDLGASNARFKDLYLAGVAKVNNSSAGDGEFLVKFSGSDTNQSLMVANYLCGSDEDRVGLYWGNEGVVNTRMWCDDTGDIRVHSGNPTADNSGTVVGTQTFTGTHVYKTDATDLIIGQAVRLVGRKLFKTTTANDKLCVGVYAGQSGKVVDSFGQACNETDGFGHAVVSLGDTMAHLNGTEVIGVLVDGAVEAGDLLCTSSTAGLLTVQADDIIRSYTVGKAVEDGSEVAPVYAYIYCG